MSDAIDPDAVIDYENATWSRCAESYAETFHLLTGSGLPLLVKSAGIAPGPDVLDLGSGPGESTAMLAATGAHVTGVDFSKPMIETARRRHPTLQFHESDVETLPFGDRTYDAVVANCVVHHRIVEIPEAALRPLRRWLELLSTSLAMVACPPSTYPTGSADPRRQICPFTASHLPLLGNRR